MPLQWNEELKRVIRRAEDEARSCGTKPDSVFLLKALSDIPNASAEALRSMGLTPENIGYALSCCQFQREEDDVTATLYSRASQLANMAGEDEVGATQLAHAILENEYSNASSVIRAFNINREQVRQLYRRSATNAKDHATSAPTRVKHKTGILEISPCDSDFVPNSDRIDRSEPEKPIPSRCLFPENKAERRTYHAEPESRGQYSPDTRKENVQKTTNEQPKKTKSARKSQHDTAVDLAKRFEKMQKEGTLPGEDALLLDEASIKAARMRRTLLEDKKKNPFGSRINDAEKAREAIAKRLLAANMMRQPSKHAKCEKKTVAKHEEKHGENASATSVRKGQLSKSLPSGYSPLALSPNRFPILCRFGRNLLAEAKEGKIDPVFGREREIEQLVDVLNKKGSNNPLLLGVSGVGKTAIIEGLAYAMAKGKEFPGLEQHTIIALDYGSVISGTALRGAIQDKINAIKNEVKYSRGNIVLFLDEIHAWLGAAASESGTEAAAELKIALSRGEILCIGATTPQEFKKSIENDPAFERRFEIIEIKPPDVKTSFKIIRDGIAKYEKHHNVKYDIDAIHEAIVLAERYIPNRHLPEKAVSALDRAGSVARRSGCVLVENKHIAEVISQIAEVPIEKLLLSEKEKLIRMEEIVSEKLIGHHDNIAKIARVIRRNQAGFASGRPIGSFLFLGPTGVGKTETAKVLADFLFGSKSAVTRFDMSEYMEQHSVAKLIGAPAGYVGYEEGGFLTEALRKKPYQLVLFDEIEKAHPDIGNIMLQLLDEGRLTDSRGRHVDFTNTVIIMTSNLGVEQLAKNSSIGFSNEVKCEKNVENAIVASARRHFTPELWNRIEEKLVFRPLSEDEVADIAKLQLDDSAERLRSLKKTKLVFDYDNVIAFLIENGGYDPAYGARPMRKTIQSHVETKVADWLLRHDKYPDALRVTVKDGALFVDEIKDSP